MNMAENIAQISAIIRVRPPSRIASSVNRAGLFVNEVGVAQHNARSFVRADGRPRRQRCPCGRDGSVDVALAAQHYLGNRTARRRVQHRLRASGTRPPAVDKVRLGRSQPRCHCFVQCRVHGPPFFDFASHGRSLPGGRANRKMCAAIRRLHGARAPGDSMHRRYAAR